MCVNIIIYSDKLLFVWSTLKKEKKLLLLNSGLIIQT